MTMTCGSTILGLIAAGALALAARAEPALGPMFEGAYAIDTLGAVPGVPDDLGGLTMFASEPDTLLIAGRAGTAEACIHRLTLVRDGDDTIIGFGGPATLESPAAGLHGGGIDGSFITFFDTDHERTMTYITSDNCYGQKIFGSSVQPFTVDFADAFDRLTVVSHGLVPCGFDGLWGVRIVTADPPTWRSAGFFLTAVPVIFFFPDPGHEAPIDEVASSMLFVKGSNPGFGGVDSVLLAHPESGRIEGYQLDENATLIPASQFSFLVDLPGANGLAIDPVTNDILVTTRPTGESAGNELFIIRGLDPCRPGELTGDDDIDAADLAVLLSAWGDCATFSGPCPAASLNCDGDVDAEDLAILLANWGPCR